MIIDGRITVGSDKSKKLEGTQVGVKCSIDLLAGKTDEQIRAIAEKQEWIRLQDDIRLSFDPEKHEPFAHVREALEKAKATDLEVGPYEKKTAPVDPKVAVEKAAEKATPAELAALIAQLEATLKAKQTAE